MKKVIASVFFLILAGCASTSTNTYGVAVISQSEYENRIEPYSKKIETYAGLLNTLHMRATLLNSQVQDAQLLQRARLYQWDEGTYNTEKQKSTEDMNKVTQVFVSLYTPEKKHDDLHKNQTLWKIFLDSNGRRWEGKATKIKLLTNEIQALYPDHTRFGTPYLVTFQVPVRSIEGQPIKLTLTGSVASASVEF